MAHTQFDNSLVATAATRAPYADWDTLLPQDGDERSVLLAKILAAQTADPALPYGADEVDLAWSGGFLTTKTYKRGGNTVKTLTYTNDGTNYTQITAS